MESAFEKIWLALKSNKVLQSNQTIYSTIESSNWYNYISTILESANQIVDDMHVRKKSVLVH